LRDPQAIGHWFAELREAHPNMKAHQIADYIDSEVDVLNYTELEQTIGQETVIRYRSELFERAEQGDRYAKSRLDGLAFEEPSDG
jgi:hypothetical protein